MSTIPLEVLIRSDLISNEETYPLVGAYSRRPYLSAQEIITLDLPAKNRVEALLRDEFLTERQLRELACDFVEHVLHVFEELSPEDYYARGCAEAARMYAEGIIGVELLQVALDAGRPSIQRFSGTKHVGAAEVGRAIMLLDGEDAAETAREVAARAQRAAHRKEWESRRSNFQPMIGREEEAAWQLKLIAENLAGPPSRL